MTFGNDQLLTFYTHTFPAKKQVYISQIAPISDGWESDVYAITVGYTDETGPTCEEAILKIYQGEHGYEKASREFHGLHHLSAAGYPVPEALGLASEDSPFGRACILIEKINGRSMLNSITQSPLQEQLKLLTLFCKLFVELHTLAWKPFVPDPEDYQTENFMKRWLLERRANLAEFAPNVFEPALDWLDQRAESVNCERFSVVHWDFHPGNILVREDGTACVIDWTGVRICDYRFDLGWTLLLVRTYGYPEIRDIILSEYERVAGHKVEQLEFFEVIACVRRLFDIFVSLQYGATTLDMRPEAVALMKQDSEHIRQVYALFQEHTGLSLPEIEQMLLSLVERSNPYE